MTPTHQSDGLCFEPDGAGFYVPRCLCGWTFGPVPDFETLCDVLMAHAAEVTLSEIAQQVKESPPSSK